MSKQESWATRTVREYLNSNWYGAAEWIVEQLAAEMEADPLSKLADQLRDWFDTHMFEISCPKKYCDHIFMIGGTTGSILRDLLNDVDWRAIADQYEEDLVREGGTKVDYYNWTWEEADGGEYVGDD